MMFNREDKNTQEQLKCGKMPLKNLDKLSAERAQLLAKKEQLLSENNQIRLDIKNISAENELTLKKIEYFKARISKASKNNKHESMQTPRGFFAYPSAESEAKSTCQATSSQQLKTKV